MTRDPEKRRAQHRICQKRYEQTVKGQAAMKRYRDKRIFLGRNQKIGIAATAEEAKAINAHIQRRKRAFKGQQGREKAESAPTG